MQHRIDVLPGLGIGNGHTGSGDVGHLDRRKPDTRSFRRHEFSCCPEHYMGDPSTYLGLESIPTSEG